jgi:hypothetical protein
MTATAFRRLIVSKGKERAPYGRTKLTFRPKFGEVAIDMAGIKARFEKDKNPNIRTRRKLKL